MSFPKSTRTVQLIALAAILSGCSAITGPVHATEANHLAAILAQMDAASATFKSAQADVKKEQYEKIVKDTTTEVGKIYFLRTGGAVQMGAKFDPPAEQTLEYKSGTLRIYSAGPNQIATYSAGKNQGLAQTFLTLGFGGSGRDLDKEWTITDQGTEQMSDGSKTISVEKLDLVSKDASVRNNFTHITIWIDPVRDVSLKQVAFPPGGDTNTAIYTNIRLNQPIDMKPYIIKCNGKCS